MEFRCKLACCLLNQKQYRLAYSHILFLKVLSGFYDEKVFYYRAAATYFLDNGLIRLADRFYGYIETCLLNESDLNNISIISWGIS